jgi:retron-type reverse transcriptase
MDRCHRARVRNTLEPESGARFEPRSYGFRPGRGCHDAIEAIYAVCKGPRSKRVWVLDADLAAAFDKIDHSMLLQASPGSPARHRRHHRRRVPRRRRPQPLQHHHHRRRQRGEDNIAIRPALT